MKIVIFPRTDGDVIVDLREVLRDGTLVPALIVVNEHGAEKVNGLSRLVELHDGGGHAEFTRPFLTEGLGFDTNGANQVLSSPDGN